jgi:hypothetical protein
MFLVPQQSFGLVSVVCIFKCDRLKMEATRTANENRNRF